MGKLTPFSYKQGNSTFHSLDSRVKFIIMCLVSVAILKALFPALTILSIVLIFSIKTAGINPFKLFRYIKYFLVLLIFVFISRVLTTPGEPLFFIFGTPVSNHGIISGALISVRLLLILLMGMLFSYTTKPSSIKKAAEWFLRPVPFIPEKKASLMIGLSIRFLPLIIEQAQQVSMAQKARCADHLRNPIKKTARLVMPILKKTFQTADNLAIAMESRCFSEERTDPEFSLSGNEAKAVILTIGLFFILILF